MYAGMATPTDVLRVVSRYLPDPEEHATKNRDFGRGFAEAIRLMRITLEET